jgi:hypothetical protein
MSEMLHFGKIVAMNAYLSPDKVGAKGVYKLKNIALLGIGCGFEPHPTQSSW